MEKKTRFKLKFVKTHLQNPKISKKKPGHKSKKNIKVLLPHQTTHTTLILFKYFNPIQSHRVMGDLVFLDHITSDSNDYVGLSTLWNPFKLISSIKVSQNFLLCTYEDTEEFGKLGLLVDRLKSLGNSESYELANAIDNYASYFTALPFSRKEPVSTVSDPSLQHDFDKCLKVHEDEPMIFYHYIENNNSGVIRNKIGANKILREMTFQDDIKIFEENLFVVPSHEYYQYMKNHLSACFTTINGTVKMYMSTKIGVKVVYAVCYRFTLGKERVIVLTFPKEFQNYEVKDLYEQVLLKERKNIAEICIKKDEFMNKNFVYKNMETWETLMKKYFEPWTNNDAYEIKTIESDANFYNYLNKENSEIIAGDSINKVLSIKEEEICLI